MKVKVTVVRRLRGNDYEHNTMPSMTEANQVKPLDVLVRHLKEGRPVPQMAGDYSEIDTPDFFKMSFEEHAEYRESLADKIESLREEWQVATKELSERKQRELEEKLRQELKIELQKEANNQQ